MIFKIIFGIVFWFMTLLLGYYIGKDVQSDADKQIFEVVGQTTEVYHLAMDIHRDGGILDRNNFDNIQNDLRYKKTRGSLSSPCYLLKQSI